MGNSSGTQDLPTNVNKLAQHTQLPASFPNEKIQAALKIRNHPVSIELLSLDAVPNTSAVIKCVIAGVVTEVLIDSGSAVNTITEEFYKQILSNEESRSRIFNIKGICERSLVAYAADSPLSVVATFVSSLWISEDRPHGTEEFYVIRNAKRSLLCRETALRYRVLMLGLNIPVTSFTEDSDYGEISLHINEITKGVKFPSFAIAPVVLRIDKDVPGKRITYTNIDHGWRDESRKRLQQMLDSDVIEEVTPIMEFSHCSAMLAVPKGKDDFRLVVDLRGPNKCIIREPHKMPTLEEIMSQLKGSTWFSTIDMSNAFFHVRLDESSRHITNFYSGEKYFRYTRLPFGLCNAPDIFQKTMEEILSGCKGVLIYLDDLLVYGKTFEEQDANLKGVLKRLEEHNVMINMKKSKFSVKSCIYLGFRIDKEGYHVTEDRIKYIKEFRCPTNLAEVRSFLGLMNFVDKFIVNRADKTIHLQKMIRDKKFTWNEDTEREFNYLRNEALLSITTLRFYDSSQPCELFVDASPFGLGAILIQRDEKSTPRIVTCASKALSESEKNYPQTQREALAVVWGTERFRFYLLGKTFTIWTDGEANEFLFNDGHRLGKRAISRAEAWTLRLLPYKFIIKRVSSEDNIADCFSRLIKESRDIKPFDESSAQHALYSIESTPSAITYEKIASETEKDENIQALRKYFLSGNWPPSNSHLWNPEMRNYFAIRNQLTIIGDVFIYRDKYVIPSSLRKEILEESHRGHFGASSMKRNLRRSLWWPKITKQIDKLCEDCNTCKIITTYHRPIPLSSRTLPEEPMEVIQVDFLHIPRCGSQEFLMITDTYSRMFWIIEMRKKNSLATCKALREIFNIWGNPKEMMTDNGPPFNSPTFSADLGVDGIIHKRVIPFCPQTNGMVERRNVGVLRALRGAAIDGVPWRDALSHYVNAYNHDIPHSVTGATPFELLTGRRYRGFFPSLMGKKYEPLLRDDIVENDASAKEKSTRYADKRRGAISSDVREGDWVVITNYNRKDKMDPPFLNEEFQVILRKDAKVIVRNNKGIEYTRGVSDVKRIKKKFVEINPHPMANYKNNMFSNWDDISQPLRNGNGNLISEENYPSHTLPSRPIFEELSESPDAPTPAPSKKRNKQQNIEPLRRSGRTVKTKIFDDCILYNVSSEQSFNIL